MTLFELLSPPFISEFSGTFLSRFIHNGDVLCSFHDQLSIFISQFLVPLFNDLFPLLRPPNNTLSLESTLTDFRASYPFLTRPNRQILTEHMSTHLTSYHPFSDSLHVKSHFFSSESVNKLVHLTKTLLQSDTSSDPYTDSDYELRLVEHVAHLTSSLTQAMSQVEQSSIEAHHSKLRALELTHELSLKSNHIEIPPPETPLPPPPTGRPTPRTAKSTLSRSINLGKTSRDIVDFQSETLKKELQRMSDTSEMLELKIKSEESLKSSLVEDLSGLRNRLSMLSVDLIDYSSIKRKYEDTVNALDDLKNSHEILQNEHEKTIAELDSVKKILKKERANFKKNVSKLQNFYDRVTNNTTIAVQTDLLSVDLNRQLEESTLALKGREILNTKLMKCHGENQKMRSEMTRISSELSRHEEITNRLSFQLEILAREAEKWKIMVESK
ncbi:hypothetical protein RCL1_001864 [Eukaryota sp. TZLM3-RCL]